MAWLVATIDITKPMGAFVAGAWPNNTLLANPTLDIDREFPNQNVTPGVWPHSTRAVTIGGGGGSGSGPIGVSV